MSIEEWDAYADEFHRDTGYLRPGKDDARGEHTLDQRNTAFAVWWIMRRKIEAIVTSRRAPSVAATAPTGEEFPARGMTCGQVDTITRAALNCAALGGNMRDAEAAGLSAYLETLTPEVLATISDRATPPTAPAVTALMRAANAVAHIDTGGPPYIDPTPVSAERLQHLADALAAAQQAGT